MSKKPTLAEAMSGAQSLIDSGWTVHEALRFYAEGKHFDVVDGCTRIIDTGAVASDALKGSDPKYAAMKGCTKSEQPSLPSAWPGLMETAGRSKEKDYEDSAILEEKDHVVHTQKLSEAPTPRTFICTEAMRESAKYGTWVRLEDYHQLEQELAECRRVSAIYEQSYIALDDHMRNCPQSARAASDDSILVDGWVAAVRDLAADLGRKNDPVGAYYDWQHIVGWIASVRLASSSEREGKDG